MVLIVCLQLILVQPQSLPQTHYYLEAYHKHDIYLDSQVGLEREFYFSYLARKGRKRESETKRERGGGGGGREACGVLQKAKGCNEGFG